MLTKRRAKELKKQRHALTASVQIGKSGLTEGTINEIKRHLKQKKTIKIRFLKSVTSTTGTKDKIVTDIIRATDAVLLTHTGSVIMIHKE